MEHTFWNKQPIEVTPCDTNIDIVKQIQSNDVALSLANIYINNNKIKLDYTVINNINNDKNIDYDTLLDFINNNYVDSDDGPNKLLYTKDLLKFYCKNTLIIEFYPINKKNIIGCIMGKKQKLNINSNSKNNLFDIKEVNFMCLSKKLRKLNLGAYIIYVLMRESTLHNNICISYYTLSTETKSKYYAKKHFFHRLINIETLVNTQFIDTNEINNENDINNYKKIYNNFIYTKEFKDNKIVYINNNLDLDLDLNKDLIQNLYTKILEYNSNTYDIYEILNIDDYTDTFKNNSFHHFIIKNNDNDIITNYVCMFRLDSINKNNNLTYRNGYLYHMFFNKNNNDDNDNNDNNDNNNNNNIKNSFELIFEYIYKHEIFDVITYMDLFNFDLINITPGTGYLYYHCGNISLPRIENHKIGVITI
jgi:hypothetical protein